jgi:hypothetical protein
LRTPDDFRWIEWNIDHATKHGCTIPEIESVVRHAEHGFPLDIGDEKYFVQGRGTSDRLIEVIYLLDEDGSTAFVIHAMPLITRRRRGRRRR